MSRPRSGRWSGLLSSTIGTFFLAQFRQNTSTLFLAHPAQVRFGTVAEGAFVVTRIVLAVRFFTLAEFGFLAVASRFLWFEMRGRGFWLQ